MVVNSALVLFGLIAAHTMLETARDALFLGKLPPVRLTVVYGAIAGLTLVMTRLNSRFILNFGRRNGLVFTLILAAFGTTLFYLAPRSETMVQALYVWSGLLGSVMVVQFWMLAGHLFTVSQGKRLFGLIAAGGVLGAVVGAGVAVPILRFTSVEGLLPVSATILLLTAFLCTQFDTDEVTADAPRRSRSGGWRASWNALFDHPFVVRLALGTAVATMTVLTTDYMFKKVSAAVIPSAELGMFFAQYYAVLNAVALLVQLFVAGVIVRRLGTLWAYMVLPALLLMGSAGVIVTGGALLVVLATKGADGALRHSLHRISTELLWMPVSEAARAKSKGLIDAAMVRGAQALAALFLFLLAQASLDTTVALAAIVAVGSVLWLGLALRLRQPYLELFRQALHVGSDPTGGRLELDLRSVGVIVEALSSRDPNQVLSAMDLLAESGQQRLIPGLILYHEADEVLVRALDIITTRERRDWVPLAERLTTHGNEVVRLHALKALARAGHREPLEGRLLDVSPGVRGQAAYWLATHDRSRAPQDHPAVRQILDMSGPAGSRAKIGLLEAIRASGDPNDWTTGDAPTSLPEIRTWADILMDLGMSDDEALSEAAFGAMATVRDPRFIPVLIDRLDKRERRAVVREALVSMGAPALEALKRALQDSTLRPEVRLHVPRSISKFTMQEAADALVEALRKERHGAVRYKILRGLGRLVSDHGFRVPRQTMESRANRELHEVLRMLSLLVPIQRELGRGSVEAEACGELLVGLLADKRRQALERAMRLLQLAHPRESLRSVSYALRSPDRQIRAQALEYVEALTLSSSVPQNRDLIRIIGDDLDDAEKVERASSFLPDPPTNAQDSLRILVREPEEALAGLAAYYALELGEQPLTKEVETVSKERRLGGSLRSFVELMRARSAATSVG